jgi:nitrogen regulatory protein PII
MENSINESAIKKLKLLLTIVDRPKAEFYLDVLSQFEINCQMVIPGKGTANTELVDMLGLNPHKAVIFSVVREDMVDPVMNWLTEKFETIRKGKGVAFAVPMSSVIGVNMYQFLSNHRQKREGLG